MHIEQGLYKEHTDEIRNNGKMKQDLLKKNKEDFRL
jgi:hypothetical protein